MTVVQETTTPAAPAPGAPGSDADRGQRAWNRLVVLWLTTSAVLSAACYPLFRFFAVLTGAAPHPEDVLFIGAPAAYWLVPAIMVGSTLAAVASWTVLLRPSFPGAADVVAAVEARLGPDFRETRRPVLFAVVVAVALLLFTGAGSHRRFTETEMVHRRFAGLQTTRYAYSEIESITGIAAVRDRKGRIEECPHYEVVFANGARWSTLRAGSGSVQRDAEIARHLAARSGRPIQRLRVRPADVS